MVPSTNPLGQPVGDPLPNWTPPSAPSREVMVGRYCRLEPIDPTRHAAQLFAAYALDTEHRNWTYLTHGPYDSLHGFSTWVEQTSKTDDPLFFAVVLHEPSGSSLPGSGSAEPSGSAAGAAGVAAYLRIAPASGSVEVGHINFSPLLQRTPASTEAMYLMMRHAFDLGYRRYEWKCDSLNAPSRAAAQRLGLSFEGVFRQATVYKGRSRDTAWYATIDRNWPALRAAFEQWLDPANFDGNGRQRTGLSALTTPLLVSRG